MRDLNYQLKQLCDRNRDGNLHARIYEKVIEIVNKSHKTYRSAKGGEDGDA